VDGTVFALFIVPASQGVWAEAVCNTAMKMEGEWAMEEFNLERKLQELVAEFGACPDPKYNKLAELARQAQDSHKKLQKSVDRLQESLDYLRICIKYQVFDLEATRRENKYLRQLLEEHTG